MSNNNMNEVEKRKGKKQERRYTVAPIVAHYRQLAWVCSFLDKGCYCRDQDGVNAESFEMQTCRP